MDYLAHSKNKSGLTDPLPHHLLRVSKLARHFADKFDAGEEAELAGLLHDLGKYGDRFQKRLQGLDQGLDHWSIGAWAALMGFQSAGRGSSDPRTSRGTAPVESRRTS